MSLFKLVTEGTWWLRSEKNPRWNCSGRTDVGGFVMPQDCQYKLEELKTKLGEPPDDLEGGYMKD